MKAIVLDQQCCKSRPSLGEFVEERVEINSWELAHDYKACDEEFKTIVGYPNNEGKYFHVVVNDVLECRVKDCLLAPAQSMPDAEDLVTRISPSRGVLACDCIERGALCLAPTTRVSTLCDASNRSVHKCVVVHPEGGNKCFFYTHLHWTIISVLPSLLLRPPMIRARRM